MLNPMPKGQKPTLNTIAQLAGVSAATVSLALKGHPSITKPTRDKVLKAAKEVGYERDANLSKLMSYLRHSHLRRDYPVIAYINNAPQREFFRVNASNRQLVQGLHNRATELGYKVEEFWVSSEKGGYKLKSLPRILRARGIQAVIIDPHDNMHYDDLDLSHFACAATCAYDVTHPPIHRATLYREETIYEAVRHLHRAGYKRIGFVVKHFEDDDLDLIRPFVAGYLSYQAWDADPKDVIPYFSGPLGSKWDHGAAAKWLKANRPEVILAMDMRIRETLEREGLRVPEDVALAYVDWVPEQGPLAGIHNRRDRTAAHALELVDAQFRRNERGYPEMAKVVFVRGFWVPGATVPEPARSLNRLG